MSQITEHLRHPSPRPQLVVDERSRSVGDAADRIGRPGPFGRERVVFALPTNAVELKRPTVVVSSRTNLVAVPAPDVLGPSDRVIVHRMVWAGKAEDTRRL